VNTEHSVAVLMAALLLGAFSVVGDGFRDAIAGAAHGNAHGAAPRTPTDPAPHAQPLSAQAGAIDRVARLAADLEAAARHSDAADRAAALQREFVRAARLEQPTPDLAAGLRSVPAAERTRWATMIREAFVGEGAPGYVVLPTSAYTPEAAGKALLDPYAPFAGTAFARSKAAALYGRLPITTRFQSDEGTGAKFLGPLLPEDGAAVLTYLDWFGEVLSAAFKRRWRRRVAPGTDLPIGQAILGRTAPLWHIDGPPLTSITTWTGEGTKYVPHDALGKLRAKLPRDERQVYESVEIVDFLEEHAVTVPRGDTLFFVGVGARQLPEWFGGTQHEALVHSPAHSQSARVVGVGTYHAAP
jgi:hypothetical protein